MKRKNWLLLGLAVIALALLSAVAVSAAGQNELAQVRAATAKYHRPEAAQADGYGLIEGLDHCFINPGVGGMGIHLIRAASLDAVVDARQPEAMVYVPGPNGQLQLGAVEYIVPVEVWEAAGHTGLPSVLGRSFHLNADLGVYVLHAWLWRDNPAGLFEDWNPRVTCAG